MKLHLLENSIPILLPFSFGKFILLDVCFLRLYLKAFHDSKISVIIDGQGLYPMNNSIILYMIWTLLEKKLWNILSFGFPL